MLPCDMIRSEKRKAWSPWVLTLEVPEFRQASGYPQG
jgi:hypothetical protein